MDILIRLVVVALKAGVMGDKIVQALSAQGLEIISDKFKQYLKKTQNELTEVLKDKNLIRIGVPVEQTDYVREEIKTLIRDIQLNEELFHNCKYDAESLGGILYEEYRKQKSYTAEYDNLIREVLYILSDKVISQEKGKEEFLSSSLVYIMNSEDEQNKLLKELLQNMDVILKGDSIDLTYSKELKYKKRLPDRTEEYQRKWNENMFLNDFDKDDEEAGVNILLRQLYQLPFYKLKGQEKLLSNLYGRLYDCTRGPRAKDRALLILGQPGMGKSTLITWFINEYQKSQEENKGEILVYRFTDLRVDWNFNNIEEQNRNVNISDIMLESLNMEKKDLNGKILILDGFDEVFVGNNRVAILNCIFNEWARDIHIKNFSLFITCRENYIENLRELQFPYIVLQPFNDLQISSFYVAYRELVKKPILENEKNKLIKMCSIFGIPIILYMSLALEIVVSNESSVVEVYDHIFCLDGGIYDRCLKRKALFQWDNEHRITEIKERIHQFSREISIWMFENEPEQAIVPQRVYEKIQDKLFAQDNDTKKTHKKDVLIGNYFKIVPCYDGLGTERLIFVHRSIYEYFVTDAISSELKEAFEYLKKLFASGAISSEHIAICEALTEDMQGKIAGALGNRLKTGYIDYTIGEYLKAKICTFMDGSSETMKEFFYLWLEGVVSKMLDAGMLYYTGKSIKEYKNIIFKEITCFKNLLTVLRLFRRILNRKYILQYINKELIIQYIKYLANSGFFMIDLSYVNLEFADLSYIKFDETDLSCANLIHASLKNAILRNANLSRADLNDANLNGADLRYADLTKVVLIKADLRGADLRGVNLSGANLSGANLRDANLSEANLSGANLRGANLRGANLKDANLSEANLKDAKLKGIKLKGANLNGANLNGALDDLVYDK